MRSDNYPWLYYQLRDNPEPDFYQSGNYNIDDFFPLLAQCMWMYQGVFLPANDKQRDVINIPHALVPLHAGSKVINVRTGAEYEILRVLGSFRNEKYKPPPIKDTPESIKIPLKRWVGDYHPDELTGGIYHIKRSGADPTIDLDRSQGDFLSLSASERPYCRLIHAEAVADTQAEGEADRIGTDHQYEVEVQITSGGPNESREPFGSTGGAKPREFNYDQKRAGGKDQAVLHVVKSQFFDENIDVKLRAPNAIELGWMSQWFEIFMIRYGPVLQRLGFTQLTFRSRHAVTSNASDKGLTVPESGNLRRLRYALRWQRIFKLERTKLRDVDLEVETGSDAQQ